MATFPHYKQLDAMDCGPTCLRMMSKYYGKSYSLQNLRSRSYVTQEGVSMLGISEAAVGIMALSEKNHLHAEFDVSENVSDNNIMLFEDYIVKGTSSIYVN